MLKKKKEEEEEEKKKKKKSPMGMKEYMLDICRRYTKGIREL